MQLQMITIVCVCECVCTHLVLTERVHLEYLCVMSLHMYVCVYVRAYGRNMCFASHVGHGRVMGEEERAWFYAQDPR